jgi:signal peptidase I
MVTKFKMLWAIAALLVIVFTACKKEGYVVTITFQKPTANAVIPKGQAVPIDVIVSRGSDIVHNVLVEVYDDKGILVEKLHEKHYHSREPVNYVENAYIPKNIGTYFLRVTSTDDDGLQPNASNLSFKVN